MSKLDQFLAGIDSIIQQRDGEQLKLWLFIDPPFSAPYLELAQAVRGLDTEQALEQRCRAALHEVEAQEWSTFIPFILQYFTLLRSLNVERLLEAYYMLSELVQKCSIAFSHPSCGETLLPTVVSHSKILSDFAIRLDTQQGVASKMIQSADDEQSETLPERAANTVRRALVTCLNDRNDRGNATTAGRKAGVYKLANICLKIFFAIKKTGNSEQIFSIVYNLAPPISLYPRSQRVTYLYYLGRFHFTTSQWYRASLVLENAYQNCPTTCKSQRRLILVYLIASNLILGRFPSTALYERQEAFGLMDKFHPICQTIAKGDLETFRRLTDVDAPNADWFLHFRILLQIRNRCEVLVWRSLARRAFLLCGRTPEDRTKASTLSLWDFLKLYDFLHVRSLFTIEERDEILQSGGMDELRTVAITQPEWIAPEFEGIHELPDMESFVPSSEEGTDIFEAESIFSSLIAQKLLNGYFSHKQNRFAIQGAKRQSAITAGFPNVWKTLTANADSEVPGWRKEPIAAEGGGRTVHITNARPVGVGT